MSQNPISKEILFFKGVFIGDLLEIKNPFSIEELKKKLKYYQNAISPEKRELEKSFGIFFYKLNQIIREQKTELEKTFEGYYNKTNDKTVLIQLSPTYVRSGLIKKISVTSNSIDPFENNEGDFSIKPVTTNYTIEVPAGATDQEEIHRFYAKGDQELGCKRGDLVFVAVHALPNEIYIKENDIFYIKVVKEEEIKKGFEMEFSYYFEKLKKRFEPEEIQFDRPIKIFPGKGLPVRNGLKYGDLYVGLCEDLKKSQPAKKGSTKIPTIQQ